jgi:hypothetical protein
MSLLGQQGKKVSGVFFTVRAQSAAASNQQSKEKGFGIPTLPKPLS